MTIRMDSFRSVNFPGTERSQKILRRMLVTSIIKSVGRGEGRSPEMPKVEFLAEACNNNSSIEMKENVLVPPGRD